MMVRGPILFFLLLAPTSVASYGPSDVFVSFSDNAEEEPAPKEPTDCEKASKDLKNDIVGLEMFLQDKSDHKTFCPYLKWEQPALKEYKKKPKSYLPKACKAEKI
jgi:hypothetical protein